MPQIYLIRTREFLNLNQPVYKIGRSNSKILTRMNGYEKGSEIILSSQVVNCYILEKELKKIFKEKFKQRKDIGTETFEGDVNEMISIMMNQINIQINKLIDGDKQNITNTIIEDVKVEIKDSIEEKNNIIQNNSSYIDEEYTEEQLYMMYLYHKSHDMLESLLSNKKDLQQLTSLSQKDALLTINNKIILSTSNDPKEIKMVNDINCANYILYRLIEDNFDDLKEVAFS